MLTDNLYEEVLSKPYTQHHIRNLYIVSGYASPSMVIRQLKEYPELSIYLLIGMVKKGGLSLLSHEAFVKLANIYSERFYCGYINTDYPVHSKTYTWRHDDSSISLGFIGSANYSLNGFSFKQNEVISLVDALDTFNYYSSLEKRSISCLDPSAIEIFSLQNRTMIQPTISNAPLSTTSKKKSKYTHCVHLNLVTDRAGNLRVPDRSGLNWGQREGREPNQAYIPIPSTIYRTDFFPDRGIPFMVYTDDGFILDCVTAQDNGKALETYLNNSELGLYFRRRLGMESGKKVLLKDLDNYGRRDVTICKIDDENYFLDFSYKNTRDN